MSSDIRRLDLAQRLDRYRVERNEERARYRSEPAFRETEHAKLRELELAATKAAAAHDAYQLRRTREIARGECGVPDRLWQYLDTPDDTPAVQTVRKFIDPENPKLLLILAGGVGTGKTVAATWGLQEARHGKFIKAIELVRHGLYDTEYWDDLHRKQLLVVDDVGTEPRDEKGYAAANFSALLDARYDNATKTILTTNLTFDQFKATYGEARTLDRLHEIGLFFAIPGKSLRRPAATAAPAKLAATHMVGDVEYFGPAEQSSVKEHYEAQRQLESQRARIAMLESADEEALA